MATAARPGVKAGKSTKKPFYCLDQSGNLHFGQTPQEAQRGAYIANKQMSWH